MLGQPRPELCRIAKQSLTLRRVLRGERGLVIASILGPMPREHLLRSLTPLYSGWLASFARQMQGADATAVDERIERLCLAFETEKRYLISRWRWPERFR